LGDPEAIYTNVFSGVPRFNLGGREGLTKIIDEMIPLCAGRQSEQTMTGLLDRRGSYIKGEGRAKMTPAKRGVNVGGPRATKPLRGADGTREKLEGAFERCDRTFGKEKRGAKHNQGKTRGRGI
jgi:hypothetical protein